MQFRQWILELPGKSEPSVDLGTEFSLAWECSYIMSSPHLWLDERPTLRTGLDCLCHSPLQLRWLGIRKRRLNLFKIQALFRSSSKEGDSFGRKLRLRCRLASRRCRRRRKSVGCEEFENVEGEDKRSRWKTSLGLKKGCPRRRRWFCQKRQIIGFECCPSRN